MSAPQPVGEVGDPQNKGQAHEEPAAKPSMDSGLKGLESGCLGLGVGNHIFCLLTGTRE